MWFRIFEEIIGLLTILLILAFWLILAFIVSKFKKRWWLIWYHMKNFINIRWAQEYDIYKLEVRKTSGKRIEENKKIF